MVNYGKMKKSNFQKLEKDRFYAILNIVKASYLSKISADLTKFCTQMQILTSKTDEGPKFNILTIHNGEQPP